MVDDVHHSIVAKVQSWTIEPRGVMPASMFSPSAICNTSAKRLTNRSASARGRRGSAVSPAPVLACQRVTVDGFVFRGRGLVFEVCCKQDYPEASIPQSVCGLLFFFFSPWI